MHSIILFSAQHLIPGHLTHRILSGKFVEMHDFLLDNIALHDQLKSVQGPLLNVTIAGALRARLREVVSLISSMGVLFCCMLMRQLGPGTQL